jgi:hypothetical protein
MEDMDDEIDDVPQVHSSRIFFFQIFVSYRVENARKFHKLIISFWLFLLIHLLFLNNHTLRFRSTRLKLKSAQLDQLLLRFYTESGKLNR